IWTAIWYKVALSKQTAHAVASLDDCLVSLLALHAREVGILPLDLGDLWNERTTTTENLYNRNWLLMYEGHLKGWLPKKGRAEVANDPNFGPLFSAGISFCNPDRDTPVAHLVDLTGYGDLKDVSDERDSDF